MVELQFLSLPVICEDVIDDCIWFQDVVTLVRIWRYLGNLIVRETPHQSQQALLFCLLFKHVCSHLDTRAPESQLLLCHQYLDTDSVIGLYKGPWDSKLKWLNRIGTVAQAAYGRNESHLRVESEPLRDMPGVVLFPQLYPTSSPYQFKKVE